MFSIETHTPHLEPVILFHLFGYPIASSTLMIGLVILVFIFLAYYIKTRFDRKPTSFQAFFEIVYDGLLGLVASITQDKNRATIIFPVVGSLMIYLFVANNIELIPGLAEITYDHKAIFSSPTADFNTTLGLAFASILVVNIIGIKEWGLFGYLSHFIKIKKVFVSFKKSLGDGFISIIEFFVGILELVGEFTKVISLSLRLLGNMYAGKVLMLILLSVFAFVIPSVFLAMHFFVGILQSIVFTSLVATYYSLVLKPKNESGEDSVH